MKKLSTMERTVLGIVWQFGPCTTYSVMKELTTSASTYYRNRAGTAYPAVQRLVKGGLLRYADGETGSRRERSIEVTNEGFDALRDWLGLDVSNDEASSTRDLIRLRMYFLNALPRESRARFLREAKRGLEAHLSECQRAYEEHQRGKDPFIALADLGALYEAKARLAWLEEVTPVILSMES